MAQEYAGSVVKKIISPEIVQLQTKSISETTRDLASSAGSMDTNHGSVRVKVVNRVKIKVLEALNEDRGYALNVAIVVTWLENVLHRMQIT